MVKTKPTPSAKLKLAVVTPTFNEIGNIEDLLKKIAEVSSTHPNALIHVLVVDDSSPDGTADEAERLAKKLATANFSVEVLVRKKKDGLGRAYIHGFEHILKTRPDVQYIIQMDADLSHDPIYLSGFIHQANEGTEFVTASRYMAGGGTPDWNLNRKILSRGGNLYTRLLLGSKITDYTGGYNMYSTALLGRINLDTIQATGYGFLIELKYRALTYAKTTAQIPIVFLDRKSGTSKIPKSTLIKNLILVPKIRFKK